jgi:ribosome-associated protein
MTMTTLELARKIATLADDKKGQDILLLDMEKLSFITDYYVIVSANNTTLVKAIADYIEDKLGEIGLFTKHKEGYSEGHWVLMDFEGVVVHVFLETEREFYNLEQLWADAPSESFKVEENV